MDTNQLTPQEGLNVINKTFDQLRVNVYRSSYPNFIVWGYLTFICTLLNIYLLDYFSKIWAIWSIFPFIGICIIKALYPSNKKTLTQLQRWVKTLWILVGIICYLVNLSPSIINNGLNAPMTLILIGTATAIQGFALRIRTLEISSIFLMSTGFVLLYITNISTFWVWNIFAFAFLLGEAIPGHIMYMELKKMK